MLNKETVVKDFIDMLGEENVISTREALLQADGLIVRRWEKAYDYEPEFMPLCGTIARSTEDVVKILRYCNEHGISVITKTGGSSSEDHLLVINDHTIYLDASPMDELICLDEENMMATVGCGMLLERLEELCNQKGLTTGHSPQSRPLAQMGGLVASMSTGQFSTYYGSIEDMVCGLEAVMPNGDVVRIRNVPRRAAGPDLRHLFVGSEGALAVITEVTVKLFRYYPDDMWMNGYIMKDFYTGLDCVREIITAGYRPSVVRLYDKPDMDYNFGSVKLSGTQSFMFFVAEGPGALAQATGEAIAQFAAKYDAEDIGSKAVEHWMRHRNDRALSVELRKKRLSSGRQGCLFHGGNSRQLDRCPRDLRDVMREIPSGLKTWLWWRTHLAQLSDRYKHLLVYLILMKIPWSLILLRENLWMLSVTSCSAMTPVV